MYFSSQPWNTAWGMQTSATWTSATSTTTTADVTSGTVTFTATSGRLYLHTISIHVFSSVAGDTVRLLLTDSSNVQKGDNGGEWDHIVGTSEINLALHKMIETRESGISGSITRKLRLNRAAGSGTIQTFADAVRVASWTVSDVGPG